MTFGEIITGLREETVSASKIGSLMANVEQSLVAPADRQVMPNPTKDEADSIFFAVLLDEYWSRRDRAGWYPAEWTTSHD